MCANSRHYFLGPAVNASKNRGEFPKVYISGPYRNPGITGELMDREASLEKGSYSTYRLGSSNSHLDSAIQMLPVRSPMLKKILSRPTTGAEKASWFASESRGL